MQQKSSMRWVILFILVFGTAMLNFSNLIFASRPTDVMEQFNMTQTQLTAISTVGQLPGAFFSVWLGHMIDKKGVRMLPGILLALAAACQIWRCFAADYVSLFIITFLAGAFFLPTQIRHGNLRRRRGPGHHACLCFRRPVPHHRHSVYGDRRGIRHRGGAVVPLH